MQIDYYIRQDVYITHSVSKAVVKYIKGENKTNFLLLQTPSSFMFKTNKQENTFTAGF